MKRFLLFINIAICITLFLFGLWPFSFLPRNQVSWLADKNGIHFQGKGIVYSADLSNSSSKDLFDTDAISIEILLQPEPESIQHTRHRHYAHILTFYHNKNSDLTIGQWKSNLNIRSGPADPTSHKLYKEIGLGNALATDKQRLITITSDRKGTSIYLDDKLARSYPNHSLLKNNKLSGKLVLGNSPAGDNPWTGKIFGLAIYGQSLTEGQVYSHYTSLSSYGKPVFSLNEQPTLLYLFDEQGGTMIHNNTGHLHHLIIPTTLKVPKKIILGLPSRDYWLSRSFLKDSLINILGFVPLGFLLSVYLSQMMHLPKRRIYLTAILLGGGISLAIELLQIYIPARSSSLPDLITNIIGTAMGVILFHALIIINKEFRVIHF